MKPAAYLTIDDSPSARTDDLCAFLQQEGIQALLFCRGDRLDANPAPIVRAIQNGFVIGNHAYGHRRASTIGFTAVTAEIARTDALIDAAYKAAGIARPGKYFRFPHMDRGAGGWVVDYDAVPAQRETLIHLFADGLNINLDPPGPDLKILKADLQHWLRENGFVSPPFSGITHPWYAHTEMQDAIDAMYTFSTADWMITPRHAGRWPYKNLDDLIHRIDADLALKNQDSTHIILSHDQDDLLPVNRALIGHLQQLISFSPLVTPTLSKE